MAIDVTLREVAQLAGVSLATASRAMRNDPVTSQKALAAVRAAAKELGYRPDPGMSRLIERRWHGRRKGGGENLAYVYNGASSVAAVSRNQWKRFQAEAEREGYQLIRTDLAEFTSARSVLARLSAQGVAGLVVALMPDVPYPLDPLFEKLPAVSIGVSAYHPACPIVMHDEFIGITHVWERLMELGYHRIGVVLPSYPNSLSTDLRLGAILCRQSLCKQSKERIQVLYLDLRKKGSDERFHTWVEKHKPDVVLGHDQTIQPSLVRLGYRVPEDLPFATFNLWEPSGRGVFAGYFRDNNELFRRGLQLLAMMIRSGGTGSRSVNLIEMVTGEWVDGKSLPATGPKVGH